MSCHRPLKKQKVPGVSTSWDQTLVQNVLPSTATTPPFNDSANIRLSHGNKHFTDQKWGASPRPSHNSGSYSSRAVFHQFHNEPAYSGWPPETRHSSEQQLLNSSASTLSP
ncbi:hypothetical protein IF1G_04249 [Cordyceps javanica]|uniref:Uncharacterized protein n=1 Tax=Cordyceps javanica TaxID=43265 RepID=A0A545V5M0_9HYPO|nr:hypothetical protein IF1G_04249 [Cordyceps javanica]